MQVDFVNIFFAGRPVSKLFCLSELTCSDTHTPDGNNRAASTGNCILWQTAL